MNDFDKIANFRNLYKAHTVARLGKRSDKEVIDFEMNLSRNLIELVDVLQSGNYLLSGYYNFVVRDPKVRIINALHYRDRVVLHCLCDEVLAPLIDNKLIYDNAACRIGKGTHFALNRVKMFLKDFYKCYGSEGYILKCDIRKFFDNISHEVLKLKLKRVVTDERVLRLLYMIIDSYETLPGKGLPLGNQTSQWFAVYYLDSLDRLIKEKLHIRYYSRYMDDFVLIHNDKDYLHHCQQIMQCHLEKDLYLQFNEKTQIFPIKNGVDYLGWHFYLLPTGKIISKVRRQTKKKYRRSLRYLQKGYSAGRLSLAEIRQVLDSYLAHLSYGNTYMLRKKLGKFRIYTKDDVCSMTNLSN